MPRPPTVRMVLDAKTERDISTLATELRLSRSAVVRLAVSQLRKATSTAVPAPTAEEIAQHRRAPGGPKGPRPSRRSSADPRAMSPAGSDHAKT